jgi:hypothetical protein
VKPRRRTARGWLLAAGCALLVGSGEARADDVAAAARAFAQGQQALLEDDPERAADRFELADSIVPSKEALRSAVRAHRQAGYLARAAALAEKLRAQYPDDATSVELANEVLAEAKQALGRVQLTCKAGCTVSVDGLAISPTRAPQQIFYLPPGKQVVRIGFGRQSLTRTIEAVENASISIEVQAPPRAVARPVKRDLPPEPVPVERRRRLPRFVPILGASLTLVGAGIATWSSFDTRAAHEDYVAMPEHEDWLDGRSKQRRTNVLWAVTAGLGAATVATAFWTDWRPEESARVSIVPSESDAMFVFSTPF